MRCAQPFVFCIIDEPLYLAWRKFFIVGTEAFQDALDNCQLIGRIENLKGLRQPGILMVGAQHAVAQAMKSADPHAAGIDRQHRGNAGEHFLGCFVSEGDGEDAVWADLAGLD